MKIKCVITDDEPIARKGMRGYIEKVDFLSLVGECENAVQLNSMIKEEKIDLLFLDIEMPYLSGLDFLSGLNNPPKVILTTAYEKYALKGYEFNVSDYLLKPISFERFIKAVNRIHDMCIKETNETSDNKNYIFVRSDKQFRKIVIDEILFAEGMENYVVIHTVNSKEITHSTLKSVLQSLPAEKFIQVHRSFIVNMDRIQSIEGNQLVIRDHKIPLSRTQHEEVLNTILKKHLLT